MPCSCRVGSVTGTLTALRKRRPSGRHWLRNAQRWYSRAGGRHRGCGSPRAASARRPRTRGSATSRVPTEVQQPLDLGAVVADQEPLGVPRNLVVQECRQQCLPLKTSCRVTSRSEIGCGESTAAIARTELGCRIAVAQHANRRRRDLRGRRRCDRVRGSTCDVGGESPAVVAPGRFVGVTVAAQVYRDGPETRPPRTRSAGAATSTTGRRSRAGISPSAARPDRRDRSRPHADGSHSHECHDASTVRDIGRWTDRGRTRCRARSRQRACRGRYRGRFLVQRQNGLGLLDRVDRLVRRAQHRTRR